MTKPETMVAPGYDESAAGTTSHFDNLTESAYSTAGGSMEQQEAKDSPEVLVRKDNKYVLALRNLVVLFLLSAGVSASFVVYHYTKQGEQDTFRSEFDSIADRILESFLAESSLRMFQARTLSGAISMGMRTTNSNITSFTMDEEDWDFITQEVRFSTVHTFAAVVPLLKTDDDRRQFEEYAKSSSLGGSNNVCSFCEPGIGFTNPADTFDVPGIGTVKCQGAYLAGQTGNLPPALCPIVQNGAKDICTCGRPDASTVVARSWPIEDGLYRADDAGGTDGTPQEWGKAPYAPVWQGITLGFKPPNMYDLMSEPEMARSIQQAIDGRTVVFAPIATENYRRFVGGRKSQSDDASIQVIYPVFDPTTKEATGVVIMSALVRQYVTGALPARSEHISIVMENTCDQFWTVRPSENGEIIETAVPGDLHDTAYNGWGKSTTYEEFEDSVIASTTGLHQKGQDELEYCRYRFSVYPTAAMEDTYTSSKPIQYALVTGLIFLFSIATFLIYDWLVQRRQAKVMASATRTNNIVSNLFPRSVRERLFEQAEVVAPAAKATPFSNKGPRASTIFGLNQGMTSKMQMKNFLADGEQKHSNSEPIADLFPHTTVLFIDIAGFTAWSSEREPAQVFKLLETLYQSFDDIGKRMKVFKVETIGDAYVAVAGVPTPQKNHAVVMVRFAQQCLRSMRRVTKDLEKFLGPSTGELQARCGLHSGAVIAGVLRGDKARFQLFGDTMNTAARLESTGEPGRIHVSSETANLLRQAGKGAWLEARGDIVTAKGKGAMQTYWARPRTSRNTDAGSLAGSLTESQHESLHDVDDEDPGKVSYNNRLVEWNTEVFYGLLEHLVTCRGGDATKFGTGLRRVEEELSNNGSSIVLDELTQVLPMPPFSPDDVKSNVGGKPNDRVKEQLEDYIRMVASLYRDVPFHNFEHASHVIMSAEKMMKRIIAPEDIEYSRLDSVAVAKDIHESTYGISSHPLMLFSVVFSALIHDVDHEGYTNAELAKLGTTAATAYRGRSIAEQNSVDIGWSLLMEDRFAELRSCIYTNEAELRSFRQLLVNAVMATDIADKELQHLRKNRWSAAFNEQALPSLNTENIDRKATIVFEYIIQASDVAHCMQHWLVYVKFNRRLFEERYVAWTKGVAGENDPSIGWYKGELWFFDNYIIPLAEKLDQCGVFGVSYHEYLNYAQENRKEWEQKGEDIVADMLQTCQMKYLMTEELKEGDEEEDSNDSFASDQQTDPV